MRPQRHGSLRRILTQALFIAFIAAYMSACDSQSDSPGVITDFDVDVPSESACSLDPEFLHSVLGKDVIPALTDPQLVPANEAGYLQDDDLVIGFVQDNQIVAVPHNIMWHHEIVNFDLFSIPIAVTYCPLTGTAILFERSEIGGQAFGVSGLLYRNNLVMYDRSTNESLWPQMSRSARCGPSHSVDLRTRPVLEMTWEAWKTLYPTTRVISSDTGFDRDYTANPYGNYNEPNNGALLYGMDIDRRRPPKERTLVLPHGNGGLAFPFGALDDGNARRVVHASFREQDIVVFYASAMQTAMAYRLSGEDTDHRFEVRNGAFVDRNTGSTWLIDGRSVEGERAGSRLRPINDAYVSFWFAWAAFHPETELWEGSSDR